MAVETPLSDLGIDPLQATPILYELEKRFDIEIPNELLEQISTVGDIVIYIDQLRQNTGSKCPVASL